MDRHQEPMNLTADGLAARLYVRAAMHPAYADEHLLHVTVKMILTGALSSAKPLSLPDRAHVAAETLRGWESRRDAERPGDGESRVIWHRAFGDTRVLVGVAS